MHRLAVTIFKPPQATSLLSWRVRTSVRSACQHATAPDPKNVELPASFSLPKMSQDHRIAQKEFASRITDAVHRDPAFSWPYFEVACRLGIADESSCSQILSVPHNQIPDRVVLVFDHLTNRKLPRSPVVFNLAVVSLARLGDLERMKEVLSEMQATGVPVTADTHNDVLLHLTKANKLNEAVNILATLMASNVLPNTTFTSMLLEALVDAKLDHQVLHVLRLLRPLGRRALLDAANLVLQLYRRGSNWERAPDVIYELDAMQIPPDEQLMNSMLAITANRRRLPHALHVIRRMSEAGMRPLPELVQTLVSLLLRQSDFDAVSLLLLQLPVWGQVSAPVTYQRALTGISELKPRRALQLLETMFAQRISPKPTDLAKVLQGLVAHKLASEAQKLMSLVLQSEYRPLLTAEHLLAMVAVAEKLPPEWQHALPITQLQQLLH